MKRHLLGRYAGGSGSNDGSVFALHACCGPE